MQLTWSKGARNMKHMALVALSLLVVLPTGYAAAQVAGSTRMGVAVEEMRAVALGWSVKKQVLGQAVYNEQNQRVGKIDDLIIAPDTAISFVIVGAGGFVGVGRHDVAIPVTQLKQQDGKFVLPGATKDAIKGLPKFEYAKK
jgi:sporulation protein YlmC with PRC-barrel domain